MPLAPLDVGKEKLDAAITDTHGIGRPFVNVLTLEEILLEFLLADLVRIFVEKLDEHAYGPRVTLLCAFAFSGPLKRLYRLVIPGCLQ